MMEAFRQAATFLSPVDYLGFAVALVGLGFLLGHWMHKMTERPVLVLLLEVLRDIQRADRSGRFLSAELRGRVNRLIGERSIEEQARRRMTEDRGYGPEELMGESPPRVRRSEERP